MISICYCDIDSIANKTSVASMNIMPSMEAFTRLLDLSEFINLTVIDLEYNNCNIYKFPPNIEIIKGISVSQHDYIFPKSLRKIEGIHEPNINLYFNARISIISHIVIKYSIIHDNPLYYNYDMTDGFHILTKRIYVLLHIDNWRKLFKHIDNKLQKNWIIYLSCCKQLPRFVLFEIFKLTIV